MANPSNNQTSLSRWAPRLAGIMLILSLLVAGWAYLQDRSRAGAIARDNDLIVAAERLLSDLKDVETGERGFIITGQDPFLEPYDKGSAAIPARLDAVVAQLGPGGKILHDLVGARLNEAAQGIAAYRANGQAAASAVIASAGGKALMDQIRTEVARIQGDAEGRGAARMSGQRFDDLLRFASMVGLVASCAALGLLALLRRREQQASQLLFEGVLENAPIGLGILDTSLRIRHINPALATMSERALGAHPGMSIWDVIPHLRGTLEGRLQRVAQGGRAASAEVEATSNIRADQVRSYQANFYPIREGEAAGAVGGVGMVIADITARKRAERSTQESEERFRSLVQASAAIIWTADPTGAFISPQPNWTRFTGQPEQASLGWGRLECIHPDDVEATRAEWREAAKHGTPIAVEHRVRRADGEWRYMALSVAPVREEDGSIREWIGSDTDITDRKEAELALEAAKEAAEAANRAKSSFLANMSHELRTPLSAVIGYSEMLEEDAEDKGEQAMLTDLGKIKSNAKHLLSLINDVLDLSKVEANKMETFAEEIDVAVFIHDATSTVEALVERKANTLVIDLGTDLGSMRSDAVKLRQCLFNLLSNAAKFTEGGTITLSAHRQVTPDGDWLTFSVRDTGIGMTPEQLSRLFQRFAQADETTTRKFGGTGLGLALSRAFARLLGGDIAVESVEGQGTTFSLRVPASIPEPGSNVEPALPHEGLGTGDLVLVIDDEASQRDLMTRFLQRQGFAVRTAAEGRTGLELARTLSPKVILLDVMMPGLDGWSVLNALKAEPRTAEIPVVMVSFVADPALSETMGAAGAVPKPVNWTRLKTVMDGFREGGGDVLVVDDDAEARQRLRSVLEKSGWTVREAADGAQALERVTHLPPPHLILLDLTMPVMDGFAFLHRLRATPGVSDIPVIVLSARDISAAEREELADADRVLKKGETSMRDLTAEIRGLEERHAIGGPSA